MRNRQEEYIDGRIATTSGQPPKSFDGGAPDASVDPVTGQHPSYWVLSDAERAKRFIRPVRRSYRHVGISGPLFPLADLSPDDTIRYASSGYVKYEQYPANYPDKRSSVVGRFWTQSQLDSVGKGCGTVTTMGEMIAETYAANPRFYTSTMCVGCHIHLPVGKDGEFVWDGTNERVGT